MTFTAPSHPRVSFFEKIFSRAPAPAQLLLDVHREAVSRMHCSPKVSFFFIRPLRFSTTTKNKRRYCELLPSCFHIFVADCSRPNSGQNQSGGDRGKGSRDLCARGRDMITLSPRLLAAKGGLEKKNFLLNRGAILLGWGHSRPPRERIQRRFLAWKPHWLPESMRAESGSKHPQQQQ